MNQHIKKTSTRMKRMALLCLIFCMASATAVAQVNVGDKGTISARVYADYYWIAQNHNAELEGNNGFWFRRIYLTYDHEISKSFSGRLRLEMNSEGDFISDSELEPIVKDAYLRWSSEDHSITAGIAATPTLGLTDDIWGYRSVEKSPLDLYDFGGSRDFGISVKGNLDTADKLNYHFMFGNGSGKSTELNKGKKVMLALGYNFTQNLVVQVYGDWNDAPGNHDRYTAQALIGYQRDALSIGALYARQLRRNATAAGDLNLDLVSVFSNIKLTKTLKTFVRADHLFDKNPTGPENDYIPISDQAEPTFLTGGVDITLDENIHLIPNIEAIVYSENESGLRPDTDLIPRLTLFYSF